MLRFCLSTLPLPFLLQVVNLDLSNPSESWESFCYIWGIHLGLSSNQSNQSRLSLTLPHSISQFRRDEQTAARQRLPALSASYLHNLSWRVGGWMDENEWMRMDLWRTERGNGFVKSDKNFLHPPTRRSTSCDRKRIKQPLTSFIPLALFTRLL